VGKNEELLRRRAAVVTSGLPRVTAITAASAKGAIITDAEGNEIIDFSGGIGVMNIGHGREEVIRAIQEQASKLVHSCIHISTYEPYVALCEKLVELFPHGESTKALLVNTGAEAVENAVKIARQATGRQGIICFTSGFHGRTLLGMSLTSKVGYKIGCGPFAPEIYRFSFPNHFRYGAGLPVKTFVERELRRFRDSLNDIVSPDQVAAVLLEPVQGEGGFTPTPPGFLEGLREICDEHGILLILDEVQSGFCRTGKWAAYQHYNVLPDISTWAKSMGGGMPIAAVLARGEIMDKVRTGTVGGTYSGNPVSCASALATIDIMERENLCERGAAVGRRVMDRLNALKAKCPAVGDVRGLGAMIGMELVENGDPGQPATELTKQVLGACQSRGVLMIGAGMYGNIIRVLTPLVITDAQLDRGLDILEAELLVAGGAAIAAAGHATAAN
jgi:4-aminobutyrate aminotransferase/(S)-3-amino-2-methylpropionate transaminase